MTDQEHAVAIREAVADLNRKVGAAAEAGLHVDFVYSEQHVISSPIPVPVIWVNMISKEIR